MNDSLLTQQKSTEGIMNHSFRSNAKFSEKLTFLTPLHAPGMCIREQEMLVFWKILYTY